MTTFFRRNLPWLGIGLIILVVDGLVKALTVKFIPPMALSSPHYPYGGIGVFKNVLGVEFSISHTTNVGAAWGMFGEYQKLLLAVRLFLIGGIIWLLCNRARDAWTRYALLLIAAGAVGNVLDSFIYGHVVDMFHFILWGYDFPVFNVADSCISVGVMLLFLFSFFAKESPVASC